MSAIRFVEIALLLSLLITYSFAAPKAVDHDSKVDKLDKIQLSGNDANDFLNNPAGSQQ
ncbi:unnamed protein product, partial [Porites evermanni]